MIKISKDEILTLYGEDVLVALEEGGYSIRPTKELSEGDKKQRKSVSVSFIVRVSKQEGEDGSIR